MNGLDEPASDSFRSAIIASPSPSFASSVWYPQVYSLLPHLQHVEWCSREVLVTLRFDPAIWKEAAPLAG